MSKLVRCVFIRVKGVMLTVIILISSSIQAQPQQEVSLAQVLANPIKKLTPQIRKQTSPSSSSDSHDIEVHNRFRLFTKNERSLALQIREMQRGEGYVNGKERIHTSNSDIQDLADDELWGVYRFVGAFSEQKETVYAARLVGILQFETYQQDGARFRIQKEYEEIRVKDEILPLSPKEFTSISTQPSALLSNATILGSFDGRQLLSAQQAVILDKGKVDGIVRGDILYLIDTIDELYLKAKEDDLETRLLASSIWYPIGKMMIMEIQEHFSVAVVTHHQHPIRVGAQGVSPLHPRLKE